MSNFICSECGMTNIDCGRAGYKTPKEIELENQIADLSKKVHILNEGNMKLENEIGRFADASKTIERLQEQLSEANRLIKWVVRTSWSGNQEEDDFDRYCDKWGVK